MFSNDEILIRNIFINQNFINLVGKNYSNKNITVKIDGQKSSLIDNTHLNKDYVYNRILNKANKFFYLVRISSDSKVMTIYLNDKLIFQQDISSIIRDNSINLNRKITKISRLPRIISKTIKLMWKRHHLLVPPRLMKQYIHSFNNNISNKNIDELFYNPLIKTDYNNWIKKTEENEKIKTLKYNPLISIIIPTYNVSEKLLSECIDSILNQTYTNFEICIADDNSSLKETIDTLKKYEKNKKVKIIYRQHNGHISECSNTALTLAIGEFVGFVDNDDVLDKNALYNIVLKLNEKNSIDLIYSDEDKLDFDGKRCMPHFKPDYSPDTFLSTNYFCHFTVIRKSIVDSIGGFRKEYDGAQDYDLFLRAIDKTDKIEHISKILYHWRMIQGSTALKGSNKNYAYLKGKKALEDYLKRNNINATVSLLNDPEMYQINYKLKSEPKISIIIPTKDKSKILRKCIDSIYSNTNYKNYEIIVIDNNSEEESTFNLLKEYKDKYDKFNYYRLECDFNYSYINNYACKKSMGEYIVLLNNDTEVISSNWLTDMVGYASQKHIGCVGAKLLYPNKTVQHCGVVTGVGGIAMHANVQTSELNKGYFGRTVAVYDWSCVTAACLMISKKKFNLLKGLDENLKVAYNDVDFCLKSLDKGFYNVVLPQVKLYHHESLSRGNDMSAVQKERFTYEINYMCDKWETKLLKDKFYNSNFSKNYAFRLDRSSK